MNTRQLAIAAAFLAAGFGGLAGEDEPVVEHEGEVEARVVREEEPAEKQSSSIRIVCWNLLHGLDEGEKANKWPARKRALKELLLRERPDLLCVQEALTDQLAYLGELLPQHRKLGAGRDDGKDAGEHCAILYDARAFEVLAEGTFWLSETPDRPSRCWNDNFNRVVTWAHLRERRSARPFVLYNTHFPLKDDARVRSARMLAQRVKEDLPGVPKVVCGDFNSGPGSREWRILDWIGLHHAEHVEGNPVFTKTFHYEGFPVSVLDGVFVTAGWRVRAYKVIEDRVDKVYPSDHFGLSAWLEVPEAKEKPREAEPEPEPEMP